VSKSLSYINGSYTEPIRIPRLAAMEGLSVSRYNTVFRQCVGVSPVRYITKLRMRQACTLLEGTGLTVKQISKIVGYEDNHFFSKIFKSYVGVSPVAYRENVGK
jgi:AraC-like DNA-binding protein